MTFWSRRGEQNLRAKKKKKRKGGKEGKPHQNVTNTQTAAFASWTPRTLHVSNLFCRIRPKKN
jgi:hypothetical protein